MKCYCVVPSPRWNCDTVVNCVDGRIESVQTRNHGDISLKAKHFVLATGAFNNGLVAEFDRVYEPLMQLICVKFQNANG